MFFVAVNDADEVKVFPNEKSAAQFGAVVAFGDSREHADKIADVVASRIVIRAELEAVGLSDPTVRFLMGER